MNTKEAYVALNMLPRIGPVRVRKLVDMCGGPVEVFSASRETLLKVEGLGNKTADIILDWESYADISSELSSARDRGIKILTQLDEEYPQPLLDTYDPPLALYVWGEILPQDNRSIANQQYPIAAGKNVQ